MRDSEKNSDDDNSDSDNDAISPTFENCQVSESDNEGQPSQSGTELAVMCYFPGCDVVTSISQLE